MRLIENFLLGEGDLLADTACVKYFLSLPGSQVVQPCDLSAMEDRPPVHLKHVATLFYFQQALNPHFY